MPANRLPAMQSPALSLFDELDAALQSGASEKRIAILRRVTDLFLYDANRLNEEQVRVFDDVLGHLIQKVETRALAQLSTRLAPVDNSPRDLTLKLAQHDEMSVAGPILTNSMRLTTHDLVEIAKTKSQGHLFAISERAHIESAITDVLLDRGNRAVRHSVVNNAGAKISEHGFATLLKASETDEALAEKTGLRFDLPLQLLRELLLRATEAVRARLLSKMPLELQEEVDRTLKEITDKVARDSNKIRNFDAAMRLTKLLKERGELTDSKLRTFAADRQYEEVVAGLSALCAASIEIIKPLMESPRDEGLLIACKGAGLSWQTTCAILACKYPPGTVPQSLTDKLEAEFSKLTRPNAERLLRFWQIRQS
jgi:hypothetical protein